jgi:hypothetical protein
MRQNRLDEIAKKLFVLRNYDKVFMGAGVRQVLPSCCGQELGLGEFLKIRVQPLDIEINGHLITMFEVTCPVRGRAIPPEWH